MTPPPRAILHIGAPKCGSSALQMALSASPELRGADGRRYAYLASHGRAVLRGGALSRAARGAAHGYANWANMARGADADAWWRRLEAAMRGSAARGVVPILSSEGWIERGRAFGARPGLGGGAPVDAIAFVRPPLDWLNAAYWQWGVWHYGAFHNRNTEDWLHRARFRLGRQVAAWAAVPAIRLRVLPAGQDAVGGFARAYGLPLPPSGQVNGAVPPALIGFLLRNRRFRPSPHASAVEFVFNRWCLVPGTPRPWAFLPRFAEAAWPALQDEVSRLLNVLPEDEAGALLADPGWRSLGPYYARLRAGPVPLDAPADMAGLLAALSDGLRRVAGALRMRPPAPPQVPAARAPVADWDAAIAPVLAALVGLDRLWRRGRG